MANIKKLHSFVKKAKDYLKRPYMILKNYIQIFHKKGNADVFCQNLVYTLENYCNFRNFLK